MKFSGKVKFLFGVIIVVFLVGLLTLNLNKTLSVAQSSKAELATDTSLVGTDYPGLITKQNVIEGDKVTKGQVLFEIQSSLLKEALVDKSITPELLSFSLNPIDNSIQLKSPDDGVVDKITYKLGSYVPGGSTVASINTVGSLHVVANFSLSPPDYARISKDSKIDLILPDNSTLQATIFSIALVRNGDSVDTVVKARIKDADISDFRFSVGTPVNATLRLAQDSWYDPLITNFVKLFKPVGR